MRLVTRESASRLQLVNFMRFAMNRSVAKLCLAMTSILAQQPFQPKIPYTLLAESRYITSNGCENESRRLPLNLGGYVPKTTGSEPGNLYSTRRSVSTS